MPILHPRHGLRFRAGRAWGSLPALFLCAVAACDSTSEPSRQVASLEVVTGVAFAPRMGEPLADDIVVRTVDGSGQPVGGVEVTATPSDGGSVTGPRIAGRTSVTDDAGNASFAWTLAPVYGEQTLTLSTRGVDDVILRANAGLPLNAVVTVTLDQSSIQVGGTTLARATIRTAAGDVIDYPHDLSWLSSDPAIVTMSPSTSTDGRSARGRGPITVVATGSGQARFTASVDIATSPGSVISRIGSADVSVP